MAPTSGTDPAPPNGRLWRSPKEIATAIKEVGIPGAIAIFLVYMGATEIPKIVRVMDKMIVEVQISRDLLREHMAQTAELIRTTRQACRNAAKDESARRYCD